MSPLASVPDPLPPVERLRPGLWTIPVPLPNTSLRYVFVYLFETDRGAYIVDAGWDTDEAHAALTAGLATAGYEMADVRGVLVTHVHPDHYGLAGRVREASGAWIALHPADAEMLQGRFEPSDSIAEQVAAMLRRLGAPAEDLAQFRAATLPMRSGADPVLPDILLEDGERPEVPGWDLSAIWTPGHSPGHLCFWEPANEVLLTGDHVLPRITPNIPFSPRPGQDPLGDFLRSLDKLGPYRPSEVLPAHEHRFGDLHRRIGELRRHHDERFREVLAAIGEGHTTAWEIAARMSWSRPWAEIEGWMRRAAVGECHSHLRVLANRGVLEEDEGEPSHWTLTEAAAEHVG